MDRSSSPNRNRGPGARSSRRSANRILEIMLILLIVLLGAALFVGRPEKAIPTPQPLPGATDQARTAFKPTPRPVEQNASKISRLFSRPQAHTSEEEPASEATPAMSSQTDREETAAEPLEEAVELPKVAQVVATSQESQQHVPQIESVSQTPTVQDSIEEQPAPVQSSAATQETVTSKAPSLAQPETGKPTAAAQPPESEAQPDIANSGTSADPRPTRALSAREGSAVRGPQSVRDPQNVRGQQDAADQQATTPQRQTPPLVEPVRQPPIATKHLAPEPQTAQPVAVEQPVRVQATEQQTAPSVDVHSTSEIKALGSVLRNDGKRRYVFRLLKTNDVFTLSPGEEQLGWKLVSANAEAFVFEYRRERYTVPALTSKR